MAAGPAAELDPWPAYAREEETPPDRARVRRALRGRDPRPRALDPDRPQEAARRGAARPASGLRPPRAAGRGPRLRQRPLPDRQRRVAARPRPPRRRRAAAGPPLR